jgi:multiple sugar transport system substrate-binding protein
MRKQRVAAVTAFAVASTLAMAGCTGGSGEDTADEVITMWTVEDVADRVAAQQAILDAYTEETGVKTELVAVAEDQFTTVLTSAAAAGDLPDLIGALSLNSLNQLYTDELLDLEATAGIVENLGADTFSQRALELTSADGTQLGVPSDGWAQLLFYRTDLFDAAGLEAPTTYDTIMDAATTLQSDSVAGIVAATAPGDSFTQQTFEHFALANDCQLVDDAGDVTLDSDECVETFDFYANLIKNGSVAGNQDADTTRASYFAGGAAMIVWSSFLLDELAGLRADALPTCAECAADPTFLAANTGIVGAFEGPSGSEPASYGNIVSWAVMDGSSDATAGLVEYMMSDAYVDWLSIAPEGKVPTRLGTADNATEYSDAWKDLEAGVDTLAVLSSIYDADVLETVAAAADGFNRWGIPQGYGELAGAVAGQLVIPQTVAAMLDSGLSAQDAAADAKGKAEAVKEDLDF